MRPLLSPGTHVLHRGDGHLQVGLDPATALVLPDRPEVRAVLDGLDGSPHDAPGAVLGLLVEQSLVVDERSVLPLLRLRSAGGATAAALARHRGPAAIDASARRGATRLRVRRFGPDCAGGDVDPAAALGDLAARAGLGTGLADTGEPREVGVLVGVGEPDRELTDDWTRAGTPYVVLRLTEGRAVVGPFVAPGETACLRCIDAHHTDADRAWPLLVHQYIRAAGSPRPDGLTEPVDPTLASLVVAWAARDLASHADGLRPSSWSTTLTLDPALSGVESRRWSRHPECGCSWQ